ncbi:MULTISPECIES: GRAM domain-containing protein [Bacillales]|uniref:GRAM domain-containing protein n=1 Tax=Bacillales TaxID=1385 RepID=UPI000345E064|nr:MULTISPECIES: GRAM domain-containing protein [Bacillales]KMZ42399.1 GRAM domain containing protein [Bacillus sp. FJAT-27238]
MELRRNESIVQENIAANLFRGREGVGGKLTITSERLYFQPHSHNNQTQPLELHLNDITAVEKWNTLFVIPNGMKIKMHNGQEHKFVVWKRAEIIGMIQDTKMKQKMTVIIKTR